MKVYAHNRIIHADVQNLCVAPTLQALDCRRQVHDRASET